MIKNTYRYRCLSLLSSKRSIMSFEYTMPPESHWPKGSRQVDRPVLVKIWSDTSSHDSQDPMHIPHRFRVFHPPSGDNKVRCLYSAGVCRRKQQTNLMHCSFCGSLVRSMGQPAGCL
ncbi:hypothetical protein XU18_5058 [Perkinsela sp. CCAP 1560/4]|nr:hypothetical protein XU18_5058 [Perkinsela sp. CCAP 1560/4]|eukprot:KNH02436.1 hypothetical protein XU18_5058 [Perkinsela sp. CCAP 1560/4]